MEKDKDKNRFLPEGDARPNNRSSFDRKQLMIWLGALMLGVVLGLLGERVIDKTANVIATIYTRLFQLLAVPTIALAVITTLASFGRDKSTAKTFGKALQYTLLTTLAAAVVGGALFALVRPENLPKSLLAMESGAVPDNLRNFSLGEHFLSVIPDNILKPMLEGNVLSILIISFPTMVQTHESDHTFSAVSIMSMIVYIGRITPITATGAPIPVISDNVRK